MWDSLQCKQIPTLSTGKTLDDKHPFTRQLGARFAIQMLSAVNMLNFADRYIPLSVKPLFQEDLGLTDFESSLPTTGMTLVFMIFALIFGTLSDKELMDRRFLLSIGIIIWSVATSLAGLSTNLVQLVCIRSLVGIGEACYGTIAPPMISDFYPEHERNIAYSIYYLAVPVGGAIGYVLGAVLGSAFGWRIAFLLCGVPGIILAVFMIQLNNPKRGINDNQFHNNYRDGSKGQHQQLLPVEGLNESMLDKNRDNTIGGNKMIARSDIEFTRISNGSSHSDDATSAEDSTNNNVSNTHRKAPTHFNSTLHRHRWSFTTVMDEMRLFRSDLRELLTNPAYMLATAGMASGSFALSGLSEWYGVFTMRYMNASLSVAGLVLGVATIVGGIGGTLLGSKVAEYYQPRIKNAYFFVPAVFVLVGAFFCLLAVNITVDFTLNVFLALCVMIAVWTNNGPISAISMSSVPPRLRSRSTGLQIFLQYVFGGMISPPIIGAMSDSSDSLQAALQITWIALLVAFGFWFSGYFFLPPHTIATATISSHNIAHINNIHDEAVAMTTTESNNSVKDTSSSSSITVINPLIQKQQSRSHSDDENCLQSIPLVSESQNAHLISSATTSHNHNNHTNNNIEGMKTTMKTATFMSILCHQDPLTLDSDGLAVIFR